MNLYKQCLLKMHNFVKKKQKNKRKNYEEAT